MLRPDHQRVDDTRKPHVQCVGLWFMYIVQYVFLRVPLFLYESEKFKKL